MLTDIYLLLVSFRVLPENFMDVYECPFLPFEWMYF